MLILCREPTFAPGEQERAGVATSCERACMGLIINAGCTSGGVNLIFGTKLLEVVELTFWVTLTVGLEWMLGIGSSVSFSWTRQTSEVSSDEPDEIPKI
jgi:hypothetical protein